MTASGQWQSLNSLSLDRPLSNAYQPFTLSQGDGLLPAISGRSTKLIFNVVTGRYRVDGSRPNTR